MSEFDNLSNKELHAKLIEYGLPNTPVTDQSRNVLIKRLHAAIYGAPASKKNSAAARRQTVNSFAKPKSPKAVRINAQTSNGEMANAANKRRTIAATTHKLSDTEDELIIKVTKAANQTTRTAAVTPVYAPTPVVNVAARHEYKPPAVNVAARHEYKPLQDSALHAPMNLARSSMPQTSIYSLPAATGLQNRYESYKSNDYASSSTAANLYPSLPQTMENPAYNSTSRDGYVYNAPIRTSNYVPIIAPASRQAAPQLRRSVSLSKSEVVTTSFCHEKANELPVTVEDDYEEDDDDIDNLASSFQKSRYSSPNLNAVKSTLPSYRRTLDTVNIPVTITQVDRRNSSNSHISPVIQSESASSSSARSRRPFYSSTFIDQNDSNDEMLDREFSGDEEGYSSGLSRNSSGHKLGSVATTPLGHYTPPFYDRHATLRHYPRAADVARPMQRRPIESNDAEDSVEATLNQFFTTIERKYHLKQSFALVFVFLVAVFIYVFFIQSN